MQKIFIPFIVGFGVALVYILYSKLNKKKWITRIIVFLLYFWLCGVYKNACIINQLTWIIQALYSEEVKNNERKY